MRVRIIKARSTTARGGGIYLERLYEWLSKDGKDVRLDRHENRVLWYLNVATRILQTWITDVEIRGNAPLMLGAALISKRSTIYIGSPIDRWSNASRWLLWSCMGKKGLRIVAVSRFTRQQVYMQGYEGEVEVCYPKIESKVFVRNTCSWEKELLDEQIIAVLAPGDKTKGWLRCERVLKAVSGRKTKAVFYGDIPSELRKWNKIEVDMVGRTADPFVDVSHAYERRLIVYLGLSEYEGLHMAVIEAGHMGIPTILWDIPAHRELEGLLGEKLIVVESEQEAIEEVRRLESIPNYIEASRRYKRLAEAYDAMAMRTEFV